MKKEIGVMKESGMNSVWMALFVMSVGCTPQSAPPGAAAPDGGSCALACAALSKATCPMGDATSCASFMATLASGEGGFVTNKATGRALTCDDVVKVQTKADAQNLGFACQ